MDMFLKGALDIPMKQKKQKLERRPTLGKAELASTLERMINQNTSKAKMKTEQAKEEDEGGLDYKEIDESFKPKDIASSALKQREIEEALEQKKTALFTELRRLIGPDKNVSFNNAFKIAVENREIRSRLDEFGSKIVQNDFKTPAKDEKQHPGHIKAEKKKKKYTRLKNPYQQCNVKVELTKEQIRNKRLARRKMKMNRRLRGIEMSSDSSMSDDPEKTGYELTDYMKEFNQKTTLDYEAGYEPEKIDDHYKFTNPLYERHDTVMPKEINFTFDIHKAGLGINKNLQNAVIDCLAKFQSDNRTNFKPREIQHKFEELGYDKSKIAMYSMIKWIADANENSGTETMTFEEFIQYAGYFFCQRHHEEGIKYIFQLFDKDGSGFLLKNEFDFECSQVGISIDKTKLNEIYRRASSDGKILKFSEFAYFMRLEKPNF